ncbi:glycerophosphodiester phosphodiesterase family protein [Rummeliibacillus stabekisii]|uniref:glycerophosphodiester phosphodiesterase family protein n=1 Tax=Rummeliibacillus stabekisii TaxID=241244 RepID=UPI0011674E41|nr:glycerophosphodiester phosphodiesterase family protein [Rummeliibacillus stabekisii]MBB5170336.1 glycerophosphoryl diester phosphodiesterase [Rummeliibacillus stabekisii]GEL04595.1 glycerophosphoryl diester phosphodiesterase [Rummeliibacillus stabekisii]
MNKLSKILGASVLGMILIACESTTDVNSVKGKDKKLILAHRGASSMAPEHTLAAYNKAVDLGTDYIEIDLRMTKDDRLIAIHDNTVNRTTNGKGDVRSLTLKEIKELDAGSWFDKKYSKERVPTIEEIFDKYGDKTNYYIETRLVDHKTLMESKLIDIMKKKKIKSKVIIESFSASSLKKVHKLDSKIPLIQLNTYKSTENFTSEKIKKWREYSSGVGMNAEIADKNLIKLLHKNNLLVYTFFFNNEKKLTKKVIGLGVDGIFTNYLDYAKIVIASTKK